MVYVCCVCICVYVLCVLCGVVWCVCVCVCIKFTSQSFTSFFFCLGFPKDVTKQHSLSPLHMTKVFLCWLRLAIPHRALATLFDVSEGTIRDAISIVITSLGRDFVPYHLGFGPQHKFNGKRVTRDLVNGELSTWISKQIGEKVFKSEPSGIADGTYIYLMNFGGFEGNKKLYSGQKKRLLSKVITPHFENLGEKRKLASGVVGLKIVSIQIFLNSRSI